MIEPVGAADIAQRLGVKHRTVAMWQLRSKKGELKVPMPKPRWTASGIPMWNWRDVKKWATKTGRLIES